MRRRLAVGRVLAWAALAGMLLLTLAPLWVVLKTALTPPSQFFEQSATLLPHDATLLNFQRVLGLLTEDQSLAAGGSGAELNFATALVNSLLFTALIVVMQVACCAMSAYAFARLRFPGLFRVR